METQKKCKRDVVLNEREHEYLKVLLDYRYLTSSLFKRLFNEKSLRTVQYKLQQLWLKGFIKRIRLPHLIGKGSSEIIYALNRNGLNLIEDDNCFINSENIKRYISNRPRNIFQIKHLLSINCFLVSLEVSSSKFNVEILEIRTYYNRPVILEYNPSNDSIKNNTIIPDAMFILSRNGKEALFFLEIDKDTEPIKSFSKNNRSNFSQKVEIYNKILETNDFLKFGNFKGFRILTVTPSTQRLESIKDSISELVDNECFWFATEDEIKEKNILTDAIWYVSRDNNLRAILRI